MTRIRTELGDITAKHYAEAIVNAANESLLGGGGVDGAIHRAAGPELLAECRTLHGCKTGQAKITKAYQLPCDYVIHTVGPVWHGGTHREMETLASCYRKSLMLAKQLKCKSIAFPMISTGVYGFPKDLALSTALKEIETFLMEDEMNVTLVVYDRSSYQLSASLNTSVREYINDRQAEEGAMHVYGASLPEISETSSVFSTYDAAKNQLPPNEVRRPGRRKESALRPSAAPSFSLKDLLRSHERTFQEQLLHLIDERGLSDVEVYKKANLDRKLFSKIRSNKNYTPKKKTALALAIALKLDIDETKDLLARAGYALSPCDKSDIIFSYFIENEIFDMIEIDIQLEEHGLPYMIP